MLAIMRNNLTRLSRDRVGLFFVFVFPIVLILLIGASFGGGFIPKVGVMDDDGSLESRALVEELEEERGIEVVPYDDEAELEDAVERGLLEGGVVIPRGHSESLAAGEGVVRFVGQPDDVAGAVRTAVDAVVSDQRALVTAARLAAEGSGSFEQGMETARRVRLVAPAVTVEAHVAGRGTAASEPVGRFDLGAASQLVLFTFVNSLAGSVALIQTRILGVSRRMLSTPTPARHILLGEAGGRFGVAMMQGLFIIGAATLLFGVRWGDPVAAGALIVAFGLVATGAAMLAGASLSNEQQAGALTPFALALAALGGCMVPLEVFSPTMRTIAHVTPHAWAVEGFTELIRRDAGLTDVLPQVGILLAFAVVLLSLATIRLRRALVT